MCVESEVSENRVKKEKCEDPTFFFCLGADNCSLKKKKNNLAMILCCFTTSDRLCIKKRLKTK